MTPSTVRDRHANEPFVPLRDFQTLPEGFIHDLPCEVVRGPLGKIVTGFQHAALRIVAYAPCRHVAHHGKICGCKKKIIGVRELPVNLCTNVYANIVRCSLLNTNTTVTDTGGTGRALTKTFDGGGNTLTMCAGTGATGATVADTNMQTQTETQTSVTVNTVTGSGSSGTFTVTATITATADRAYTEVGLKTTTTTTAWVFLLTRDTFSVLNVSNSGTLAVTYTFTNS